LNGPIYTLDRTDLKILDILQADGRISNSKLAELVNLSPTAVMARVQKLTKDEFILGYEAKLNPNKLNANFLVFVEVLLDKTTPHVLDDFIDAVTQYPEIVECHMVSGGFDFLIKLRSAGMEEFRRIAGQILWQLPGVKETRSYPVMQVVKDSSKIKIKSKTKF
jgi:Lrp/AsnC family leucine-responsive transcriptional regulator